MKLSALLISAAVIAAVPAWAASTTTPPASASTTTTSPSGPSTTTTTPGTAGTPGSGSTTVTTTPSTTTTTRPSTTTTTTTVSPAVLNTANLRKAEDKNLKWGNFTADQLDDMNVVDSQVNKIGEVDDVLIDQTGKIVVVTVEMGGFLGIGEKHYLLDITKLTPKDKALQTTMTKEQLQQQPQWNR